MRSPQDHRTPRWLSIVEIDHEWLPRLRFHAGCRVAAPMPTESGPIPEEVGSRAGASPAACVAFIGTGINLSPRQRWAGRCAHRYPEKAENPDSCQSFLQRVYRSFTSRDMSTRKRVGLVPIFIDSVRTVWRRNEVDGTGWSWRPGCGLVAGWGWTRLHSKSTPTSPQE
jgi:hypothetical protein